MKTISDNILNCKKCELSSTCTNKVVGEGNPNAKIFWVGEAPGADEDLQGRPFVGRSGKLLNVIIQKMGLTREECFISNILHCRPPNNRKPTLDEMKLCGNFVREQIRVIKPEVIIVLGATAMEGLLGVGDKISKRRGKWEKYKDGELEIDSMIIWHPSYMLRNPASKLEAAEDLVKVMDKIKPIKLILGDE